MKKELCVLEEYLNAIQERKKVTKKLAETIFDILDALYEMNEAERFWIGDIYLTNEGYFYFNENETKEYYEDENKEYRQEVRIVTDTKKIRNGGYFTGEYSFRGGDYYEWWVKTINSKQLIKIAKNLKKWIIEYIEKENENTEKLKESLTYLKKEIANLDDISKSIKEDEKED